MRSIASCFVALTSLALASTPASLAAAQIDQPSPVIERIEPTSGPPGTTVQVIGRYFRRDQEMLLHGVAVEATTRLPNRWTIRVPEGATTGRLEIRIPDVAPIIGPEFRVMAPSPAPVLSDVQPRSGAAGTEVRLLGDNFSPRITENQVTLAGRPVVVRTAAPHELVVIVPAGAEAGTFSVRVSGAASDATSDIRFEIGAGVSVAELSPPAGPPGSQLTIRGVGFVTRARDDRVFIGTRACRVVRASATELVVEIPRGAASAPILVDVRGVGRAYSSEPFRVQELPTVSALVPPAGTPGAEVLVRGQHFGTDIRVVAVALAGAAARVRAVTDTELTIEEPEGASSGPVAVTIAGVGPGTSSAPFRVLAPVRVTSFAPRSGGPGTEVTISGSGFSPTLTENRVLLSGVPCEIVAATGAELRVRIPRSGSGPLAIEVEHGGSARTSQPFVVTSPPFIARFEPARAVVGDVVTVHGASFGTSQALVAVTIGGRAAEIRSFSDTRLEVAVPAGARTGRIGVVVRLQGSAESDRDLEVLSTFAVRAIEPASAYPDQSTIRGEGFTASGMEARFTGSRAAAEVRFESATELRVMVPEDAATGPLTIRSADERSAEIPFERAADPEGVGIGALEPACLRPRCAVVVRGWGFAARASGNTVTIGTGRARVRRATPHRLEVELPRTPGTMTIRIEVRGVGTVESAPITIAE